jgi:hypothetical protein
VSAPDAPDTTESDASATLGNDLRIYKLLAPGALLALALLQIFLGLTQNLTPWKGGGFGMFSTVDGPSARVVRVYLQTADRELPIRLPGWIRHREKYAISLPADFRLRSIATRLTKASWHYVPHKGWTDDGRRIEPVAAAATAADPARAANPDGGAKDDSADKDKKKDPILAYPKVSSRKPGDDPREDRVQIAVTGVRLEVWRRSYDRSNDRLSLEKITELSVEAPPK